MTQYSGPGGFNDLDVMVGNTPGSGRVLKLIWDNKFEFHFKLGCYVPSHGIYWYILGYPIMC